MSISIPPIVLDTNVVVAGLRSRRGSTFQLLTLIGTGLFDIHLSVPLMMEYRDVLSRANLNLAMNEADIEAFTEFHCLVAAKHQIFFLWRPYLPASKDDMVLDLAVTGGCDRVVTYNYQDVVGIERFGIRTISPAAFLQEIGALS